MKSRGFTLIELLVVVAIISLLSSVVLASVKDARQKAQVSAQRTHMKQIVNALELYRADNPNYPTGTTALSNVLSNLQSYIKTNTGTVSPGFTNAIYYSGSALGCGGQLGTTRNIDPYLIYYQNTSNPNLQLPKLTQATITSVGSGNYSVGNTVPNWYCASLSAN